MRTQTSYVHVDLDRRVLRHASAGHPPAMLRRAAEDPAVPVGPTGSLIIPFAPPVYPVADIRLASGDRVVLYTDGVIEAMRGDGEMFGVERLAAAVADARPGSGDMAVSLMSTVAAFAGRQDGTFEDDCTVAVLDVD